MSIAEIVMLVCFGIGWPISIAKSLRTKVVAGKSPIFMIVVSIGYVAGIVHKYYVDWNWVAALYVVNILMVLTDLSLYFYYLPRDKVQVRAG
jgi:hypothetical protein